ncbi:MAG: AAA family ATPase, partial [Candidatus Aenigmarchaeota archaeon]|nr:AAA family ATPase [Candidatus Aenigmarchaeota archaeon]
PGTGKTKISNELAGLLNKKTGKKFKVLHLNSVILRRKLWSSIDKKRGSKNADMKRLGKFVSAQTREHPDIIIESHLAHYFRADVVFVLRTRIKELKRRMERRGWNEAKIEENLEAERLNLILGEALDIHGRKKCIETDTTSKTSKTAAKDMLRKAGLLQ